MPRKSSRLASILSIVGSKAFLVSGAMALVVFFIATAVATASSLANQYIVLPKLNTNALNRISERTKIFAADGRLLTVFYHENREMTRLEDVPLDLSRATIAIEDQRFFRHNGVDFRSIVRAMAKNAEEGQVVEGGSTITQQLVKNVYLTNERTIDRKVREAILATQLEHKYKKTEILEIYLNTVYYGNGAYGTKTAAELFFNKKPKDLTLGEAALLAGLPKAPSKYSPYLSPEKAKSRRHKVLKQMLKMKFINRTEFEVANAEEVKLRPPQQESKFAAYFVEYVRQTLKDKYGEKMVYGGGLDVYTTLDPKLQEEAENAVAATLNRPGDPSAALVAIEPKTGAIKAIVGGKDFDADQFNLAVQGRRQAGSAFKTFVLVTALGQGIKPETPFSGSSPQVIRLGTGQNWQVKNFGGASMGTVSLHEATVKSVNVVYAQLIMRAGAANVARTARKMGISSPVDSLPAIALGGLSKGVSPLDMASAYGTLANNGAHVPPTAITKIVGPGGKLVFAHKPKEEQVIEKKTAAVTNQILQDVVNSGTGQRAKIGRPVAGKTGTSENLTDAWFVGYTPQLVTSVWVGYPKSKIPMESIHGIAVVGGSFPAEIWNKFMSSALAGMPVLGFAPPDDSSPVEICAEHPEYRATPACPRKKTVSAEQAKNITASCPYHQPKARPAPPPPTQTSPAPAPEPAPEEPAPPAQPPEPKPEEPAPPAQPPEPEPAPKPKPKPAPVQPPAPPPAPEPEPDPVPPESETD